MLPGLTQAAPTAHLQAQLQRDFPQRLVAAAGGQQALRECGTGPVVVLLHGIGSGAASWLQVAQHLAAQARVIAWDAPGYGDSSPWSRKYPRPSNTLPAWRRCSMRCRWMSAYWSAIPWGR